MEIFFGIIHDIVYHKYMGCLKKKKKIHCLPIKCQKYLNHVRQAQHRHTSGIVLLYNDQNLRFHNLIQFHLIFQCI